MRLRRTGAAILGSVLTLAISIIPARASGHADQRPVNWNQHDTAVYVVSTLNLLRTHSGRPFTSIWVRKGRVTHFDVYADGSRDNLYFIEMKRSDDSVVGALAYQMGWDRPRTVTTSITRFHIPSAPDKVIQSYQSDVKFSIGSFSSTLPA